MICGDCKVFEGILNEIVNYVLEVCSIICYVVGIF